MTSKARVLFVCSANATGEVSARRFEDPVTSSKPDAFRHTLLEIHERIKMFILLKSKRREPIWLTI